MEEIDIICLEKRIIKIISKIKKKKKKKLKTKIKRISKIYREVKKSQFGGK